jgi:hypothetical protein
LLLPSLISVLLAVSWSTHVWSCIRGPKGPLPSLSVTVCRVWERSCRWLFRDTLAISPGLVTQPTRWARASIHLNTNDARTPESCIKSHFGQSSRPMLVMTNVLDKRMQTHTVGPTAPYVRPLARAALILPLVCLNDSLIGSLSARSRRFAQG